MSSDTRPTAKPENVGCHYKTNRMKKSILALIMTLMTNFLFAQTDNYKTAIDNFQVNYNTEKYDKIFNDFSPEMKQALPLEKTNF